jgi:hypothetical protein
MTILANLEPGDIMFAQHVSPKSADLLILRGQLILGQPGYPHHVGVVVECTSGMGAHLVQAMPKGAEEVFLGDRYDGDDYTFLRPAYEEGQGEVVARAARAYVGTPYSFADYVAILGVHLGIKHGLVRRYVTTSKHQICSQLADQAMSDARFHVFTDGRLPQDVTPGALFEALKAMPGTVVVQ